MGGGNIIQCPSLSYLQSAGVCEGVSSVVNEIWSSPRDRTEVSEINYTVALKVLDGYDASDSIDVSEKITVHLRWVNGTTINITNEGQSDNTADYVVIYDISDNRERQRISKLLKGFGKRIQKSVFECRLNKTGKKKLIEQLKELDIKTGFIKIYRLEYSFKNPVIGKSEMEDMDSGAAFVF